MPKSIGNVKQGTFTSFELFGNSASKINFNDTDGSVGGYLQYNHANDKITLNTAGSDRMTVDSGGITCNTLTSSVVQSAANVEIKHDTETMAKFVGDGAAELYHNNVKKLETTSDGISVTGDVAIPDGSFLKLGTGNDLLAFHDGNNSFLRDNGTGILQIGTNGTHISIDDNANSKTIAQFKTGASDARVELYHDNTKRFETTSSGATVTGSLTITGLPTSDPSSAGALWNDSGTVKVSAG